MISQKVSSYANENGFRFHVNGCGHRTLAQITTLDGQKVGWTTNRSADALNSINSLIQQRRLAKQSNAEIASEASAAKELIGSF